jgi:P-type conjugative transfer protein TrbJ
MHTRKLSLCFSSAVATLFLLASPQQSQAQFLPGGVFVCANCSTAPTQATIAAKQALQYLKDVEVALNTYNHLQLMIREVQQLAEHPSTNIGADLALFSGVLQSSASLAMDLGQMDAIFNSQFQPFAPSPVIDYSHQYAMWATTALAGLHGAANSTAAQGNMIQNEQLYMQQLNALNQQQNGIDQGIQISNSVGLETVAQLERLRMLTIAGIQQNSIMMTTALNTQQANVMTQANQFTDNGIVADQRGW